MLPGRPGGSTLQRGLEENRIKIWILYHDPNRSELQRARVSNHLSCLACVLFSTAGFTFSETIRTIWFEISEKLSLRVLL